jgi:iron complex transport system substrate-binding protein
MNNDKWSYSFLNKIVVILFFIFATIQVRAEIEIIDVAGRTVILEKPATKVVLGEGRFFAVLGVLGIENPVSHVAGMMNEFKLYDPAGYQQYQTAFPDIDAIPTFGHTSEQSVSVEKIILLDPDVAIFGLNGHGPGARSKHITDRLEAAGIPIVFIDFRQDPINNTVKSVKIVGQVMGKDDAAEQYANLYKTELKKVTDGISTITESDYPSVLFELRADREQECCFTVAKGLFADMAEIAGGYSIAKDLLPGPVGQLSFEHVINSNFDVYIGSAIGSMLDPQTEKGYQRLLLGPGVDTTTAKAALDSIVSRPGFIEMPAVKYNRAHGIWHHFYNSPLNIYAVQKMAQWFHPELFSELEPEKMLDTLLDNFDKVDLSGTYAISK